MPTTALKSLLLMGGGSYASRVLATGPLALWPLSETSGTTASELVFGGNGTYTGATLNAATFAGSPAPTFAGTISSYADLYSAGLASAFNASAGTALVWARVASTFWTDGVGATLFNFGADGNNVVRVDKAGNNQLRGTHAAGAVFKSVLFTVTPVVWFQVGLTWSVANDRVRVFYNGAQQSTNQTALGTWAGDLNNQRCGLANAFFAPITGGAFPGALSTMALWARELTPGEVASLYVPAFAV